MPAVNPHEGQVAIPYSVAPSGVVIGRLGARAMRWVEQAIDQTIDDVYVSFVRSIEAAREGNGASTLPINATSTVIWAAIEHERRMANGPGPEFTIDDGDAIVDEVGIDDATGYALALIQLSMPFRKRTEELEKAAAQAGVPNPVDPLRAAARRAVGTGTPTSTPPSTPGYPPPPPGT